MTRFEYVPIDSRPPLPDWHRNAPCGGQGQVMDALTPSAEEQARRLCSTCSLLTKCTTWVLSLKEAEDPGGVCAGWTAVERRRLRRGWSPHGSGCRCFPCKMRRVQQRMDRIEQAKANPELITHGTTTAWVDYGCRCTACEEAGDMVRATWTRSNQRRQQAAREVAS